MGQLMGQEMLTASAAGVEFSLAEIDIVFMRECLRIQLLAHLIGLRSGMHPHPGKIRPHRLLHGRADFRSQGRTATPAEVQLMLGSRIGALVGSGSCFSLDGYCCWIAVTGTWFSLDR